MNITFAIEDQSKEESQEINEEIAVSSPAIEKNKETHSNKEPPLLTQSQTVVQKLKAAKKQKINI